MRTTPSCSPLRVENEWAIQLLLYLVVIGQKLNAGATSKALFCLSIPHPSSVRPGLTLHSQPVTSNQQNPNLPHR
jgi:hypothetical protein